MPASASRLSLPWGSGCPPRPDSGGDSSPSRSEGSSVAGFVSGLPCNDELMGEEFPSLVRPPVSRLSFSGNPRRWQSLDKPLFLPPHSGTGNRAGLCSPTEKGPPSHPPSRPVSILTPFSAGSTNASDRAASPPPPRPPCLDPPPAPFTPHLVFSLGGRGGGLPINLSRPVMDGVLPRQGQPGWLPCWLGLFLWAVNKGDPLRRVGPSCQAASAKHPSHSVEPDPRLRSLHSSSFWTHWGPPSGGRGAVTLQQSQGRVPEREGNPGRVSAGGLW